MYKMQLILNRPLDGADLLKLSMEYKVHISLIPNPLGLRVEGLRGALSDLSSRLLAIKNVCLPHDCLGPCLSQVLGNR